MTRRYPDFRFPRPHWTEGDIIGVTVFGLVMALVVALVIWGLAAFLAPPKAFAHDSWINKGGYKNPAGEWCCGDYDCKAYKQASSTAQGWMVEGELVPYDEAMPIAPPDGVLTVCRRPDGSRRCVFGLKPGL